MNYLLPQDGVLSMHCSANIGPAGRHGAVLRPLRHGQDDALRRPGAPAHRRRRARLERRRRLQLRRRLLREGASTCRAEDEPDIYATTQMFGTSPRERRARPGHAQARLRRRVDHREHARGLPAARTSRTACRRARRAPEEHRLPDGRRLRRAAADRAAHARAGDVLLPVAATRRRSRARSAGVTEPQATFSACFGAPFLRCTPTKYARDAGRADRASTARTSGS